MYLTKFYDFMMAMLVPFVYVVTSVHLPYLRPSNASTAARPNSLWVYKSEETHETKPMYP
jgi:hypothetical protein